MDARRDERTEGFSGAPRLIVVVTVVVILPGRVNSNRNRLEPLVTCFNVCGDGSRKLGGDVRVREHCGALLPAGALVCVACTQVAHRSVLAISTIRIPYTLRCQLIFAG